MKILMMTNNYTPLLNGVTKSIMILQKFLKKEGHEVLIVAPAIPGQTKEKNVIRTPALKNMVSRMYSIPLPIILGDTEERITKFKPDIIHSHHPFLLGGAALRLAAKLDVPLVYTRHTRYEHYMQIDSPKARRIVLKIVDYYSGLADAIIAPSESIAHGLRKHGGIAANIKVIPSGIDTTLHANGNRAVFREYHGIPDDAFLVGYIGRFEPEKNLDFLCRSLALFLEKNSDSHCLLVGSGTVKEQLARHFERRKVDDRLHLLSALQGKPLAHAYASLDAFAFASVTETQGLVLVESMAAGAPVIGIDASGVRDIVENGINGRIVPRKDVKAFIGALEWLKKMPTKKRDGIKINARKTAKKYSPEAYAEQVLGVYRSLIKSHSERTKTRQTWNRVLDLMQQKWTLYGSAAVEGLLFSGDSPTSAPKSVRAAASAVD